MSQQLRLFWWLWCGCLIPPFSQSSVIAQTLGGSDSTWIDAEEQVQVTDTVIAPSPSDTLFVEEGTLLQLEGEASYYADAFEGRPTSCGERFQQDELTAAHREFPFGTVLKVVSLANGAYTIVRINDRGPWRPHRIIDLSRCAAQQLGMLNTGVANVRLEILRWGP
ncbi:MAG: septal ring lytic transglycosylase RlpA family protein [Armatimonadetes bacterium]|nr:septal ring lytic transglycosylase RlpA family protein [Armatimonadota bacterium]